MIYESRKPWGDREMGKDVRVDRGDLPDSLAAEGVPPADLSRNREREGEPRPSYLAPGG